MDLTFYDNYILAGLYNGRVVLLDKTNYKIISTSILFDHIIWDIRILKNKDIAIAKNKGIFFAKLDNMSIKLINQSFLKDKDIYF